MSEIDPGLYRRVLRRELHSSRSGSTIVVLVLLTLVVGYVGVEAVYAALGRPALLFSPVDVLATLTSSVDGGGTSGHVLGAGVVAALVGLVLVALAVTAGRRGRHTIDDDRVAVVVDDRVIASSLARTARTSGRLSEQQVSAWVSRRRAQIDLTPSSGLTVDDAAVGSAARAELESVAYRPALSARVRTTDQGRLGA
ncbi:MULTISPECIES: hypothetical protein [unclassified Frigoribacterium]|uniref:hypothetical protein n=1 Tax=unclassified Frigoribacterium TaxID=2627005 RepID=UPI0006F39F37|nr:MULTISPECIES: hypothetical protein [unclassified Frigoribacterium]KQO48342.1 hypothetical protein ASF07_13605 [Frigoribacterium sp. Leaf254]KQT40433.1 hypothetical protein ASG28_13610 [Frigoribacterium sp. Leaf415]